ncbi:hypothetical protein vBAspABolek_24 [Aeromonas phage vB_AspA_Bolek]|nr:hypothetical protein vBAspABolek_24 [Aeromonas phage vB_AspA_Bolek]
MVKFDIEFAFRTRVGECIITDCYPEAWARQGMKQTKRNRRKAARFYRFREGVA